MSFTYTVENPMESMELITHCAARGYMGSYEQRAFMFHLGMVSQRAAEIGAYCGLSSVLVGMGMKDNGRYYCIDNFESSNAELTAEKTYDQWQAAIKHYGLEDTCIPVKGWSFDLDVYAKIPGNLDFVYIDGDHETDSVLLDALMYRHKLKPGGLLLFHDTPWPKVSAAINSLQDLNVMRTVRVIHDFTICRIIDHFSDESRSLTEKLLAAKTEELCKTAKSAYVQYRW